MPRPSHALLECLLHVAGAMQETSALIDISQQSSQTFARFAEQLVTAADEHVTTEHESTQLLWDLHFLVHIATLWGSDLRDIASLLRSKIEELGKVRVSVLQR